MSDPSFHVICALCCAGMTAASVLSEQQSQLCGLLHCHICTAEWTHAMIDLTELSGDSCLCCCTRIVSIILPAQQHSHMTGQMLKLWKQQISCLGCCRRSVLHLHSSSSRSSSSCDSDNSSNKLGCRSQNRFLHNTKMSVCCYRVPILLQCLHSNNCT